MTMYERIKNMTLEEMRAFLYYIYLAGNKDGMNFVQDSFSGYFARLTDFERADVMPNDRVEDVCDTWEPDHHSHYSY